MRWVGALVVAGCSYSPSPQPVTPNDGATDQAVDLPIDVAVTCPAGFDPLPNAPSKYRASATPRAYDDAVADCAAIDPHVHLTRVNDQGEVDAVMTLAGGIVRVVGHRHLNNVADPSDDTWHDLDDVTLLPLTPWGFGEPTDNVGEFCMSLRDENFGTPPAKVSGADDCTTARLYVCECE